MKLITPLTKGIISAPILFTQGYIKNLLGNTHSCHKNAYNNLRIVPKVLRARLKLCKNDIFTPLDAFLISGRYLLFTNYFTSSSSGNAFISYPNIKSTNHSGNENVSILITIAENVRKY